MGTKVNDDNSSSGAGRATRRQFLADMARTACGVGLLGLGIGVYSQRAGALPAEALRPPGALPEEEFLAACTRCGLCVRDCPYDMLHLARLGDGVPLGTPYFYARQAGCEMCEDIPCVPVCPTGALSHGLTDINKARMGLAVLSDQETCVAFLGLRCEVCFNICPIRGKAITLETEHNVRSGKHARFLPVVHSEHCTGCGKCEEACILDESAIRILPNRLVQGKLGAHYRKGWEEKAKAGEALVTPDLEHRYNLPEGVRYEHGGRGLILEKAETPPSNPADILNRGLEGR
ncbi:MAG: ferredoxin-type protein NapG [Gammaproteobacteria bacterium]|nr:ferredoxin-type protein NapG [Gammaproteobacteria bacterium]MBU1655568.1 ferredoxin-type protein NapG [Gammaproteobacteria bacterium]MBU1960265.1 ferredoxin-type protein NapG [Gammaproteobacteria bacterium]